MTMIIDVGNKIGNDGTNALIDALKMNTSLTQLGFDGTCFLL